MPSNEPLQDKAENAINTFSYAEKNIYVKQFFAACTYWLRLTENVIPTATDCQWPENLLGKKKKKFCPLTVSLE